VSLGVASGRNGAARGGGALVVGHICDVRSADRAHLRIVIDLPGAELGMDELSDKSSGYISA
jgi:hypothetical protein